MITVNSAMQQENIKTLLEGIEEEGVTFSFKEKKVSNWFLRLLGKKSKQTEKRKMRLKERIGARFFILMLFKQERRESMLKNGLLIISLSLILFLNNIDALRGFYNWPLIVIALIGIFLGSGLILKWRISEKQRGKTVDGN